MSEISRRKFIQLTVLSGAVAAAGCKNETIYKSEVTGQYGAYDNRALPYVIEPDGMMEGVPQYFATACQMCPAGCGLFVKTLGGRAVKVEGSPDHPISGGKSCARGQASLQHLYNPDRLRFPALGKRGATQKARRSREADNALPTEFAVAATTRTDWETALARTAAALQSARGRTAIVLDGTTLGRSPTVMGLVTQFARTVGATVVNSSLLDDAPWRAAARAVYGRDQIPAYQIDQADFLLAFGANFLEAWPSPVLHGRQFGAFRQGARRRQGEHGRFLFVGPRMSMTAAKADQWIPCTPGTEGIVAQAVGALLANPTADITAAARASGVSSAQLAQIADGFRAAGTRALAMGGDGVVSQPGGAAQMIAIESLNSQVKSQCVSFGQSALPLPAVSSGFRAMQTLTAEMAAGKIGALVLLGQPNPVFTLPSAVKFTDALARVPFVAALTPFEDETTHQADVLLPTRSFLEDWGDDIPAVLPADVRMASLRQPIIDPQFVGGPGLSPENYQHVPWMDTRPVGEILMDLARRVGKPLADTSMRDAVRRTWAGVGQANLSQTTLNNDTAWVQAVSLGGIWTEPETMLLGTLRGEEPPLVAPAAFPSGTFALQLYPHIYWTDGRGANLGWLQENPDPMTMAVWNSWVEINAQTADRLGIQTGDIVRLSTAHGAIDVPAVPFPGLHPNAVAMPIGQGHVLYGRNAQGRGLNPLSILDPTAEDVTGALAWNGTRVTMEKVRDAKPGYNPAENTLVVVQDRDRGEQPDAVKDLIHTTAKEWKQAKPVTGAPQAEGTIFKRGGVKNPGERNPGQ